MKTRLRHIQYFWVPAQYYRAICNWDSDGASRKHYTDTINAIMQTPHLYHFSSAVVQL